MQLPRAPNIVASCLWQERHHHRHESAACSRSRPNTAGNYGGPPSAVAIREHSLTTTSRNWPVDTVHHPNSFTSRSVMLTFRSRLANWTSTRCFGSRWEGPITTPLVSFLTMTWPFTVMSWVAFTF